MTSDELAGLGLVMIFGPVIGGILMLLWLLLVLNFVYKSAFYLQLINCRVRAMESVLALMAADQFKADLDRPKQSAGAGAEPPRLPTREERMDELRKQLRTMTARQMAAEAKAETV